ncbi:MAG: KaiC domain-containing protein [archaeon]
MSEDDREDDWFERALAEASEEQASLGAQSSEEQSVHRPNQEATAENSLFEEDFASAFEAAGSEESPGEAAEEQFGEDFESDIPRIDLGIEGLDGMIQGGIPQQHLMVVIGSPGTGKTTFGLQFLHHGLENGENAVFITLEQHRESILDTATERGWAFDQYERDGQLSIVDLDPVEMANSLRNIRGEFPGLVRKFGADRLVLDSVSLLEMMYDDPARRRTEVFDFTRSLKDAGVTTMLTSEANENNPYASRHGIIEYLTDAVFVLQYVRGDTQETRLAVEIQKIRNANHTRQTKPYAITLEGIDVYQQASIF